MSRLAFLFLVLIISPALVTVVRLTESAAVELAPAWSPDSRTIAYERTVGFNDGIYVMSADGSNLVDLGHGRRGGLQTWSPDGSEVAYVEYEYQPNIGLAAILRIIAADGSQDRIVQQLTQPPRQIVWARTGSMLYIMDFVSAYTVPTDGSAVAPPPVIFARDTFSHFWSPDGTQIAYLTSDGALWIMQADGTNARQVYRHVVFTTILNWSPDGQKLMLDFSEVDDDDVWSAGTASVRADGSDFVKLDAILIHSPEYIAWSPDSSRIAFTTGANDIYVMNADGSQLTPLATSSDIELQPTWSPDGSKLAFIGCYRSYVDVCEHEVYTVNADGSGRTRITATKMIEDNPVWSPDGSRILLSTRLLPYAELYVQGISQRTALKLSDDLEVRSKAWSPDGRKIGLIAGHNYLDYNLYTVDADGQHLTQLPIGKSVLYFAWSPDGQHLAMTTARLVEEAYEVKFVNQELRVSDVNGVDVDKIAQIAAAPLGPPVWSPDSRTLAYLTGDGETRDLYLVNEDGSGQRKLVTLPNVRSLPAWSPAGDKLAIIAGTASDWWAWWGKLYVIDVAQGTSQLLADDGVVSFAWSPDGKKLVFGTELHLPTPDGFTVSVINADGTDSHAIANYSYPLESPFTEWRAEWSPDGTWLAFRSGYVRFTVMRVDGSTQYDFDYNGYPVWSPDGRFLSFADYQDSSDIYVMSLVR